MRVGDACHTFRVTPAHASILCAFRQEDGLSASALSAVTGIPPYVLRRKALFWVNNGVLLEKRGGPVGSGSGSGSSSGSGSGGASYWRAESLDPGKACKCEGAGGEVAK